MSIAKIGIIGAGQMGSGIAQVCAVAGYDVLLNDVGAERVKAALAAIDANLGRQVAAGKLTEAERKAAMAHLGAAGTYDAFADADLVIEAAVEDEAVKRQILRHVSTALKPDRAARHQHLVDLDHPAGRGHRPAGEIHRHPFHEPGAEDGAGRDHPRHRHRRRDLRRRQGIHHPPRQDGDAWPRIFPAFIVNRILLPMINEAIYALHEGVGSVDAIDTAMRLGAHHPMGPLQLADFIGLDTCLSIMQVLHEGLADSKYRPCPLLVKYVEAGWLGRKSGRGFYDYRGEKPVPTR